MDTKKHLGALSNLKDAKEALSSSGKLVYRVHNDLKLRPLHQCIRLRNEVKLPSPEGPQRVFYVVVSYNIKRCICSLSEDNDMAARHSLSLIIPP